MFYVISSTFMIARPLCRICGCLREETEKSASFYVLAILTWELSISTSTKSNM
jgi:hypothetical protein